MKKITILLSLLIAFLFQGNVQAQITAREAILEMSRGINLGNTLDPPNEGDWNNGPAQEYYFDDFKAAGFKTVRVPVTWDAHTSWSHPNYPVDATWMNRVEEVIDWGLDRDLYVILNMHHENWFFNDHDAGADRFYAIWAQIIERFKNKGEKLIFEILNEPTYVDGNGVQHSLTQTQVNNLNGGILSMIRAVNPTRLVVFGGKEWTSSHDLITTQIPAQGDQYLIGYYHSYDPFFFAHECQEQFWGSDADKAAMASQFDQVKAWSDANDIPVLLGEFGCRKCVDYNSMMEHYRSNVEFALSRGFAFTTWDDGGWFGIYNRDDRTWHEIKDVLIGAGSSDPCGDADPFAINGTTRIEAENYCQMSGIQTEDCSEGGQNVGWIDEGDWMAFAVDIPSDGEYTVSYRVASLNGGGAFNLEQQGGDPLYGAINIAATGDWQNWETISHTVQLTAGVQNLAIAATAGGWNINWLEISGESNNQNQVPTANAGADILVTLPTNTATLSGSGTDPNNDVLSYSWTQVSGPNSAIFEDETQATTTVSDLVEGNYIFNLSVSDGELSDTDQVAVSVSTTDTGGTDCTPILLPNTIEAEAYCQAEGVQEEDCIEGGQNVGWIDAGDWLSFSVDVPTTGTYTVSYRVASQTGGGELQLEQRGGSPVFGSLTIPNTGGWQSWQTISHEVTLQAGAQDIAIAALAGGWNINWLEITNGTTTPDPDPTGTCDTPTPISVSFSHDGAGEHCWVTSDHIDFANSWGMDLLEINGVDYTNLWVENFPERINGNYYIKFQSNTPWAHFEANQGSLRTAQANVEILPNPANNTVIVNFEKLEAPASLSVYNLFGQKMLEKTVSTKQAQLDIAGLEAGIYIIKVNKSTIKMIKR